MRHSGSERSKSGHFDRSRNQSNSILSEQSRKSREIIEQCEQMRFDSWKNDHQRTLAIDLAAEEYRKDEFDHFQAVLDYNKEYPVDRQAQFFDYKMLQDL